MQKRTKAAESYDDIPANVADLVGESLYQQDYFIHTVLNTVDALVMVVDSEDRIVLFNSACERLTGYTFSEVKGKTFWHNLLLPEEKQQVLNFGKEIVKAEKGETLHYTNHVVSKDGWVYLIEWSSYVFRDCQGQLLFIVCTGIDITEREKVKKALEYSEKLFHSIFDNANDAILVAPFSDGKLGNYIEVNNTASRLLGYTKEEFLMMSPATIPVLNKGSRHMYDGNLSATFDSILIAKNGEAVLFEYNAHLFEMDGQTFSVALARDVRERKQKERELQDNEKRYRKLVELCPDAIFVHDGGHFLYANKACARLLRAQSAQWMINRSIKETQQPESADIVKERIKKIWKTRETQPSLEHMVRCFDGAVIEVEAVSSFIYYHGQPAIQVVMRDITKKKKTEQEMLRASKLKTIGSLAGNIAHEYNNILTVILGNLSLAQYYTDDKPKVKAVLKEAEGASRQAQELTQRLLTFARGGQPVKRAMDIRNLLIRCASMVTQQENTSCNLCLPGDLLPVNADENQIYHAISNVVTNALQAMPEGGTVHIAAENMVVSEGLPVSASEDAAFIKITIRDEGDGIAEEHIGNIFDPFFTTKAGGSGLGLSTAYSIIKKHGGYITVESEKGQGAAFIINLPAASADNLPAEQLPVSINGSGRVLFMDDEAPIRRTTQEMLMCLGYEGVTAVNGEEALQLYKKAAAEEKPFKFVILDLRVADGMGGKDTLKQLLEFDPTVRAVVSSGYFSDPVMANYKKYGFLGCVPKPFTIEQLALELKKLEE